LKKILIAFAVLFSLAIGLPSAHAQAKKPNILVIFGDDIGIGNISAYNLGSLGYRTANIDRIAKEGALFTTYYGQQSCTAGRSAFITGQVPFRTGLSKVGLPGSPLGISKADPTIAELLKPLGYTSGQFGKNHLGDRDEFLPTNHGFDEFFGNLYHLNAEEEPEDPDYPTDPEFKKKFGPRGVIHSYAGGAITDTGPLDKKRMETVDDEFLNASMKFMDKAKADNKPFFVWFNSTRTHIFTHLRPESVGKSGAGLYGDALLEHDAQVGVLLDKLDKMGIADNTIVIYTSDNGAMASMWPDAGSTPFRSEKNTNWEGGWRVPAAIRWPGVVKPGTYINDIFSAEDWAPTLVSAAGDPDVTSKLLKGYKAGNESFHVHLDGYDQTPLLSGKGPGKRDEFMYFSDDGDLLALRYKKYKIDFMVQRAQGLDVWREPFVTLRAPLFFDLNADPYEKSDISVGYNNWWMHHAYIAVPVQSFVGEYLSTFKEFPPRQKPASFGLDQVLEKLVQSGSGSSE
jgi:arylsulfatase A-like enzyme